MLLVEDEPHVLMAMCAVFREEGYAVRAFARPDTALPIIVRERPTLVITDEDMPGMAGHELADRVRAQLGPRTPRLLLVTGANVPRAIVREFDAVLYKPFRLDDLLQQARRLGLRHSRSGMRLRAATATSDDEAGTG